MVGGLVESSSSYDRVVVVMVGALLLEGVDVDVDSEP